MSAPDLLSTAETLHSEEFDHIPIIDLALPNDQLVEKIREACLVAGFFYVKNHSVSESTVQQTFDTAKRLFQDLSKEDKMKLHISQSNNFRGYQGLYEENTNPENKGDLHEAFNLGYEPLSEPAPIPTLDDKGHHSNNIWPADETLEGFRSDVLKYYHEVLDLGYRLFPLFALALGLPEDFFNDKTKEKAAIMRLLHYPSQAPDVDINGQVQGIGAHTDYECFTILRQGTDVGALQVLNRSGEWIDAPPIKGTFVINIADQLSRWSNDIFVSTRHRAINRSGRERYSIPFFFGTDYNVVLEPFHTCVSADRPARYEPILAGEYVRSRLDDTYGHKALDVTEE
ncbi:Iron/ascorbate family oxidoreductases [Phaffia rhodozyma]|uniref:Iron/ascorbate family oxidoreductases n=1 Tax=Phaffia rhodozyma TaxID=264483 RepID=A0A0F7SKH3_PHARH|nr:Iron/ascorbate family oxidoreductases [Phaffia rhodozyma]